ncbi:solute carrier organic anion transporter family, member 1D1 isoform X2 [Amia ocellicauda]|uniref:solute carrier organic anion transporter family, member 1D1 isoform X2 n=1 Tax=Amia ocellicauda TaxID=2972642 RepID=UPI003464E588
MGVENNKMSEEKAVKGQCCSKLKLFLVSLSVVYFAKALQGSYMKSSITQIERCFDIPSSLIGVIDGSFEMGNLLVIAFVSHFGAKLHRPRLIGIGCLLMSLSSFLTALPHLFMGQYQYETSIAHSSNITASISPCLAKHSEDLSSTSAPAGPRPDCVQETGSSMWVYVFLGNMLRGIGETPVIPLGVSYIDDFAREENTAFYLSCIQTIGIMGPIFGFLLGSLCAKLYVDFDSVNLDTLTINSKDARWVGAWWLGFLVSGVVMLVAGIPFWFLPRSIPKQGKAKGKDEHSQELVKFIGEEKSYQSAKNPQTGKIFDLAKDFLPSLKKLFHNSVFSLIMCVSVIQVNAFMGIITFMPKFMEQIYGQSASKATFLIGVLNLPAVAAGIFTGGLILKKCKLSVIGIARLAIGASFTSFLLMLVYYALNCENTQVAGLTISYEGVKQVSYQQQSLLSKCNTGCSCSLKHWDPVCAHSGVTFVSSCLAGCRTSTGTGKQMVFYNCSCLEAGNSSAILGQCPRPEDCDTMFKYYMFISVVAAYLSACGATPMYIILLRSIKTELKSLALGIQTLFVRTLGGIPAPIYFGALIDRTCLKWSSKACGSHGACRLYDSDAFRKDQKQALQKQAEGNSYTHGQEDQTNGKKSSVAFLKNEEVVERELSI